MAGPVGRARNGVVAATAVALTLNAHAAFGQEAGTPAVTEATAQPGTVRVEIRGDTVGADLRLDAHSLGASGSAAYACHTPCAIHVRPGRLTFEFRVDGSGAFVERR